MDQGTFQNNPVELTDEVFVGGWRVNLSTHRVTQNDEVRRLEPRLLAILTCLLKKQGEVVTRKHLEAEVWPNSVIGYDTLSNSISRLRKILDDNDKAARIIETIPKVGYRVVSTAPIQGRTEFYSANNFATPYSKMAAKRYLLVLVAVALFLAGSLYYTGKPDRLALKSEHSMLVNKPTLAVLPFVNLSQEPEQDFFSYGLTDDLITSLSKLNGLHIISRYSSFAYHEKPMGLRELASELGVQYFLEGSIRKVEDRIRVNVNLVDVKSDSYLWAESYDDKKDNLLQFQNQLRHKVTKALSVALTVEEQTLMTDSETFSASAYESFLKGWEHFKRKTPQGFVKAKIYLTRAVNIDPKYDRASAALAALYWEARNRDWGLSLQIDPDTLRRSSVALISNTDAESNDIGLMTIAKIRIRLGEYQAAIHAAERAYELAHADLESTITLTDILLLSGETSQALQIIQKVKGQILSPNSDLLYLEGLAAFHRLEYQEAVPFLQESIRLSPHYPNPKVILAAVYAYLNQTGPAGVLRDQILENLVYCSPYINDLILQFFSYQHEADRVHLAEGLRRAGVPEFVTKINRNES